MPAWVVPLVTGLASVAGQLFQNKQNQNQAKNQMGFQERMSNTAVQRSVLDYARAGLNPALAYERTASSPGGAMAEMNNLIEPGIQQVKGTIQQRQAMRIADEMQRNQNMLMREQAGAAAATNSAQTALAEKTNAELQQIRLNYRFNEAMNPKLLLRQDLDNNATRVMTILNELGVPAAANSAALERMMGKWSPALKKAGDVLPAFNVLRLLKK